MIDGSWKQRVRVGAVAALVLAGCAAEPALSTTAAAVTIDDVEGTVPFQFGPAVVALHPESRLTLRNTFPAPFADAHFYYFVPPAGATKVSVHVTARGDSPVRNDLVYCGAVTVSGDEGAKVPPELNNAFLWVYDPAQFAVPASLAVLTPCRPRTSKP